MMCKFLQTPLSMELDWRYNSSVNIPIEKFHRFIPMTLQTVLQWDSKRQIVRWCDIYIDKIANKVTIKIIISVNPLIIFNLWPDTRPLSPPPSFLLLPCKISLYNKTTTPPFQSQHNSTSHNFSSHHNTRFVSIHVLI
jgi:hypothetical protein